MKELKRIYSISTFYKNILILNILNLSNGCKWDRYFIKLKTGTQGNRFSQSLIKELVIKYNKIIALTASGLLFSYDVNILLSCNNQHFQYYKHIID